MAPVEHDVPTAIDAAVLEIVRAVLRRPHIGLDDDVFDFGATSLAFVRVLAEVNQRFHVLVPAADLAAATPRCIAAGVARGGARPVVKSEGA